MPGFMRSRRLTGRLRWTRFLLLAVLFAAYPAAAETPESAPQQTDVGTQAALGGNTFRVFAHPEGLVGYTTANGHVIQPNDFFVALPCFCALSSQGGHEFQVKLEYEGTELIVPVWDVGPWNVSDNYWDPPEQREWSGLPRGVPQAQAAYNDNFNGGLDGWGREVLSPAGMDIADGAFAALGMTSSDWVNVTFLWQEPERWELQELPDAFPDIATVWWDERPLLDSAAPIQDGRYHYVVETGHNVPNVVFDYWATHGGWRAVGLPVSEFFREVHADGTVRFVQYFERSILTVAWDANGAPYVTAANLGYETYIDPTAAAQVPWFPADDYAVYFEATGHALAGGFRRFWDAHGSYEVFGAPLSEEWGATAPDGRKVVYQVFERARFEWWPDKVGTGEEITLGLLSIELLQRAGWEMPER